MFVRAGDDRVLRRVVLWCWCFRFLFLFMFCIRAGIRIGLVLFR